jgi:hypothetical protein
MRINFFSGPGAGKSVVAAKTFVELKIKGYNVELAKEYIKTWAYKKLVPKSFDQYYIFGKQLHEEDVLLSNGVEHIVSDSPLLMQLSYMERSGNNYLPLLEAIQEFEIKYPSFNIFLDRTGLPYRSIGRYENETQASEMDNRIKSLLNKHSIPYVEMKTLDFEAIMDSIISKLG